MRLTCPNCGAQYEVPDDVIPAAGRDVQCSNCGNTWFQAHPDHADPVPDTDAEISLQQAEAPTPAPEITEDAETEDAPPERSDAAFEEVEPPELSIQGDAEDPFAQDDLEDHPDDMDLNADDWDLEPEWEDTVDDGAEAAVAMATFSEDSAPQEALSDLAPEEEATPALDDSPALSDTASRKETSAIDDAHDTDDTEGDLAREPVAEPTRVRRGIDASVADILREEAALESEARAAETPASLETQAELGLEEGNTAPQVAAARRLRRLRKNDDARADLANTAPQKDTRRDLLPDIEEINSTLRTGESAPRNPDLGQGPTQRAKRGKGFRLGFIVVLLLAAAAVFVYGSHDSLSASYPAAAPYIDSFMTSANSVRLWLDAQVTQLFLKLNEMTG